MNLQRRFHSHLLKVSKWGKYVIHYLISIFFHFLFLFLSLLLSLVTCFWILNNFQRNLADDTRSEATVTRAWVWKQKA